MYIQQSAALIVSMNVLLNPLWSKLNTDTEHANANFVKYHLCKRTMYIQIHY